MNTRYDIYGYVMSHLDEHRFTQRQIANGSGVPFSTVCKVAQRRVKNPRIDTIQRLADFFESYEGDQTFYPRRTGTLPDQTSKNYA
jgi:transcriptional regulator with XRE-family HTH domain